MRCYGLLEYVKYTASDRAWPDAFAGRGAGPLLCRPGSQAAGRRFWSNGALDKEQRVAEILIRREGAIGTVVVSNVEKHNAMTMDMWRDLAARIAELDADPAI